MTKLLTTIMTVAIHSPSQDPYHGEGVTHISLANHGDGFFFVLRQPWPTDVTREPGELALNPDELEALANAGQMLLKQEGTKE